jgi:hypothetical protein
LTGEAVELLPKISGAVEGRHRNGDESHAPSGRKLRKLRPLCACARETS